MFRFIRNFLFNEKRQAGAQAEYAERVSKIESAIGESSEQLKTATQLVTNQAIETANVLKRQLDLFERKFNVITDSVDDAIVVKTMNREWVSINRFACDIFKLDRDKVVGKTNAEIAEIYPRLKPILLKLDLAEQETIGTNQSKKFRVRVEEGGKALYLDIMITIIRNSDSTLQEIILVGHNNTKFYETLRQSQSISDFMNAISSPVVVLDSYEKVVFINKEFQEKFGIDYTKAVKQSYKKSVLPEYKDCVDRIFSEKIQESTLMITGEKWNIKVTPIINTHVYDPVYYFLTFVDSKETENVKGL